MNFIRIDKDNYSRVAAIYQEGLDGGIASFETQAPTWETWDQAHLQSCRIAAMNNDKLMLRWAALSPVSSRCVYGGVVEASVYIAEPHQGKGVGKALLNELIQRSERQGLWTLQSGTFPNNNGSIALHLKCGFRKIGYKEKIGQRDGVWYDNILFERRSQIVGI